MNAKIVKTETYTTPDGTVHMTLRAAEQHLRSSDYPRNRIVSLLCGAIGDNPTDTDFEDAANAILEEFTLKLKK